MDACMPIGHSLAVCREYCVSMETFNYSRDRLVDINKSTPVAYVDVASQFVMSLCVINYPLIVYYQ